MVRERLPDPDLAGEPGRAGQEFSAARFRQDRAGGHGPGVRTAGVLAAAHSDTIARIEWTQCCHARVHTVIPSPASSGHSDAILVCIQ